MMPDIAGVSMAFVSTIIVCVLGLGAYLSLYYRFHPSQQAVATSGHNGSPIPEKLRRIQVVVLGDIGRSPRMQYHALSIARHDCHVDLIGYLESALHPDLQSNKLVTVHPLPKPPSVLSAVPFVVAAPLKVIWQTLSLIQIMLRASRPSGPAWIIVQNPPSIPTFHVSWLVSRILGSNVMVDWHNYGWSILATTKGRGHPFVKAYRLYEQYLGGLCAAANLTVTDAMARELRAINRWSVSPIRTLHDRPTAHFQPITVASQRRDILARLDPTKVHVDAIAAGRTRLVVSSTSWTPDEDFQMLVDAMVSYASYYSEHQGDALAPAPKMLVIVTGRGPQKAQYEALIQKLQREGRLSGVMFLTAWLSTEDYASLLACADLGVCLHTSSSGVDLPMKVVDMFGAGIPVVAYGGYQSFEELVKDGVNGQGFTTANGLSQALISLLSVSGVEKLSSLKEGAIREGSLRWDEEWDRVVAEGLGI